MSKRITVSRKASTAAMRRISRQKEREGLWLNANRTSSIALLINVLTLLATSIAGACFNSAALTADALHAASDLIGDIIVLAALHISSSTGKSAFHYWPRGTAKIESIATLCMGGSMLLGAFELSKWSLELLHGSESGGSWFALLIALVNFASKFGLSRLEHAVAHRQHSGVLHASSAHHESDAMASLVTVFSVLFAKLGFHRADPIGAMVVTLLVAHSAQKTIWSGLKELLDKGVSTYELRSIKSEVDLTLKAAPIKAVIKSLGATRAGGKLQVILELDINKTAPFDDVLDLKQILKRVLQDREEVSSVLIDL